MKFGVREICNVTFKAKSEVTIGNTTFKVGQPVLYIDSAKTSTLEGAATTVYAQGGRGNTRLIAWEGEKTLTFTVEDALLSPLGLSVLSGAGLIKGTNAELVHVHMTTTALVSGDAPSNPTKGIIDLTEALEAGDAICEEAPLFIMELEGDGSLTGTIFDATGILNKQIGYQENKPTEADITDTKDKRWNKITCGVSLVGKTVMVDYYVVKKSANISEIQIDAENFAGYYYVEADTLFRRQSDGVDMPANITLPNVKIQSNFTFSMASTGDPSTFTFTMDAFPGYTYFDKKKKVLCVIQVVEDVTGSTATWDTVMPHTENEDIDINGDGVNDNNETKAKTDGKLEEFKNTKDSFYSKAST